MLPHTCGIERVGESRFGNINLEQHARQDQVARVSRATVAEAMTWQQGMCGTVAMILRQAYLGHFGRAYLGGPKIFR